MQTQTLNRRWKMRFNRYIRVKGMWLMNTVDKSEDFKIDEVLPDMSYSSKVDIFQHRASECEMKNCDPTSLYVLCSP